MSSTSELRNMLKQIYQRQMVGRGIVGGRKPKGLRVCAPGKKEKVKTKADGRYKGKEITRCKGYDVREGYKVRCIGEDRKKGPSGKLRCGEYELVSLVPKKKVKKVKKVPKGSALIGGCEHCGMPTNYMGRGMLLGGKVKYVCKKRERADRDGKRRYRCVQYKKVGTPSYNPWTQFLDYYSRSNGISYHEALKMSAGQGLRDDYDAWKQNKVQPNLRS